MGFTLSVLQPISRPHSLATCELAKTESTLKVFTVESAFGGEHIPIRAFERYTRNPFDHFTTSHRSTKLRLGFLVVGFLQTDLDERCYVNGLVAPALSTISNL